MMDMNRMNTSAGDNVCDANKNHIPSFTISGQVYRKWRSKFDENFADEKHKSEFSLGQLIGVSFGNFNINDIEKDRTVHMQLGFACCLVAFGETFITPETKWDEAILNRILSEGRTLLNKTRADETGVKSFSLCDNAMQVFVDSPDVIGQVISNQQRILSFEQAICIVFRNRPNSSYLLRVKDMCILIWFRNNCYYVFDAYGRNSRCERDVVNGCAVIMCLKFLKNVSYLITHLCNLQPDDTFVLQRFKMVSLIPCCRTSKVENITSRNEFNVLNQHHAILQGSFHISSRREQSLAVGYCFLLYSKIDPPSTYGSEVLNKILVKGINEGGDSQRTFVNLPTELSLGDFTIRTIFNVEAGNGNLQMGPHFRNSSLVWSIKSALKTSKNILVDVGGSIYPICLRSRMYYLLDPFSQRKLNQQARSKKDGATLHMFSDVDLMLCEFTQKVLTTSFPRSFKICTVKIIDIFKTNEKPKLECSGSQEISSLNESITDFTCDEALYSRISQNSIEDLDSPTLSRSQIQKTYDDFKREGHKQVEGSDTSITSTTSSNSTSVSSDSLKPDNKSFDMLELINTDRSTNKKTKKEKIQKQKKPKKDHKNIKNQAVTEKLVANELKEQLETVETNASELEEQLDTNASESQEQLETNASEQLDTNASESKEQLETNASELVEQLDTNASKSKEQLETNASVLEEQPDSNASESKEQVDTNESESKEQVEINASELEEQLDTNESESKEQLEINESESKEQETNASELKTNEVDTYSSTDSQVIPQDNEDVKKPLQTVTRRESMASKRLRASRQTLSDILEDEPLQNHLRGLIPNRYPGLSDEPRQMVLAESKTGSYKSLCKLITVGLSYTDRIFMTTPCGNYVLFKNLDAYLLYEGCTCDISRFQFWDLSVGTAGLLCFADLDRLINKILLDMVLKTKCAEICTKKCCVN